MLHTVGAIAWLHAVLAVAGTRGVVDWRNVATGGVRMPGATGEYYNQPQAVQLLNGSWLVLFTNAGYKEGQVNQRVVSRVHPSPHLEEPGWYPPVDIENQPWGPSAGWVVPLYVPSLRRVYAIYTYNEGERHINAYWYQSQPYTPTPKHQTPILTLNAGPALDRVYCTAFTPTLNINVLLRSRY